MRRFQRSIQRTAVAVAVVALALAAGAAVAQDEEATVQLSEHEQYGQILTDVDGRTLYLFANTEAAAADQEPMMEGIRASAAPCEGGCLDNWPALAATSVMAGDGLDADLLYVEDVNGTMQVVYNGWPLYYFANDAEAGDANGQGLGGGGNVWYVVGADGMQIMEGTDGG